VLGIDPLSPDYITLELVDLLNDTAWKVVQAGDMLLLDIGQMGVYDDARECLLPALQLAPAHSRSLQKPSAAAGCPGICQQPHAAALLPLLCDGHGE
jgi:hypothetical protein